MCWKGPGVMRHITITNTGDAPINFGNFTRSDGGADTTLVVSAQPAIALDPAQAIGIDVTYTPTLVAGLDVALTSGITGVLNMTSTDIRIQGKGIDRQIELASTDETFPDTYRNPGSMAPVKPITVRNLGEAPLAISAVMVTGEPTVWELVDKSPVVIPGLSSHDFMVRFTPTMAGPAPDAALELMHDDDMATGGPIARVTLRGNGIDRQVNFGVPEIHLGYTGVGIPFTLEDAIEIRSMDPTTTFTIRDIVMDDPDGFVIDGAQDVPLEPNSSKTFSITFTPDHAGEYVTMAKLYLDEDPVATREVKLVGTAVFVDAHGGGGCSTGDGGLGAGMVLLVLVALRRRTRGAVAVVAAFVIAPAAARADNIVLSIFDPTPSTTTAGFQVASPEVGKDGDWVASAVGSFATDQFVHTAYVEGGELLNSAAAVKQSSLVLLGGAYALKGKFEVGARMALYQQQGDAAGDRLQMYPGDPASGTALGDFTLHGKVLLLRKGLEGHGLFTFGAALHLTMPTGSDHQFTGVDLPSARGLLLMTLRPGAFDNRLTLVVNAGGVGRAKAQYANLEQKSGATFALGLSYRAFEQIYLDAETFGDFIPSGQRSSEMASMTVLRPIEWLVGGRWYPDRRVAIGLGGGRGLTSSAGSPALRAVLTLTFAPGAAAPPRLKVPEVDLDSDEDGIRDRVDACKFKAEDKDGFEDTDGCPDADNDKDNIADGDDKCPNQAEDLDDFQDKDGCPDDDNDGDGTKDITDKCKGYPEDKDNFEDADGCPDPDNDKDGLEDSKDGCPNDPETINGNKDNDGCPDNGDSLVMMSPDRLELLDTITFFDKSPKLKPASLNVLGQVAATLRAHPEIVRIRVTVHTFDSGNDAKDQELTDKRAATVRDWIVQWGIPAARVEARGFGNKKPIGKDKKVNERVELIILEKK